MALTTRWITDPETGELYFAIGPFANTDDAIPVQRVVMSCISHPSYPERQRGFLTWDDGVLTQAGRAMLWLKDAGEAGITVQGLADKLGFVYASASNVLRAIHKAGLVERIKVKGERVRYVAL